MTRFAGFRSLNRVFEHGAALLSVCGFRVGLRDAALSDLAAWGPACFFEGVATVFSCGLKMTGMTHGLTQRKGPGSGPWVFAEDPGTNRARYQIDVIRIVLIAIFTPFPINSRAALKSRP